MKYLFLSLLFAGILLGNVAVAQDEDCSVNLSNYTEFYNQKNYRDAYIPWKYCFDNCQESGISGIKNIYIQGPTILENLIIVDQTERRELLIDTLLMIYDARILHYGQKGLYLGRKAIMMYKYRPDDKLAVYNVLKEAFELNGDKTEYTVMNLYMAVGMELYNAGTLDKATIVDLYSSLSEAVNSQAENEAKPDKKEKILNVAQNVEEIFVNSTAADCKSIIEAFTPKFEAAPDDVELSKKIINILKRGKSDECRLSDLYMNAAIVVYNAEKSSSAAHAIGQAYFKRDEHAKAEKYYNEAISLESDASKKADMYYELGLLYFTGLNNYSKARQAARNALAADPSYGKAYLLIGRVYAAGGKDCGETAFDKKCLYCLVVDQFQKAKNIDPSLASDANELIARYSDHFPTKDEAFWVDVQEGQSVTIGCWINESTTVRFSK